MWHFFVLTLLNFGYILTFNVDTKSPIILSVNSAKGLFGHSISISENGDAIIGAPESETHGNVFLCRNIKDQNPKYCNKLSKLISLCTCNYVCVWCFFKLWFFSNHIFETISDSDLTSVYKYFLGARLAKDNNQVKTDL